MTGCREDCRLWGENISKSRSMCGLWNRRVGPFFALFKRTTSPLTLFLQLAHFFSYSLSLDMVTGNPLGSQTRPCYTCPTCHLVCKSSGGLTRHQQTVHREFTPVSEDGAQASDSAFTSLFHPLLNGTVEQFLVKCQNILNSFLSI